MTVQPVSRLAQICGFCGQTDQQWQYAVCGRTTAICDGCLQEAAKSVGLVLLPGDDPIALKAAREKAIERCDTLIARTIAARAALREQSEGTIHVPT